MDGLHQGLKLIQVHKVDGPHQGSRPQSTKWMDPTRVSNLYKSTKWTDPTKGQDPNPQSGRTPPGSQIYTSPQSGRTPPRVKTPIHKVDGPHQWSRPQSTKWTNPTRVSNLYNPLSGRTHSRRTKLGSRWTDPANVELDTTKIKNFYKSKR